MAFAALLRGDGPQQQEALHRDGVRDRMCHDSIEEAGALRVLADPAATRVRAERTRAAAADGNSMATSTRSSGCTALAANTVMRRTAPSSTSPPTTAQTARAAATPIPRERMRPPRSSTSSRRQRQRRPWHFCAPNRGAWR